MCRRRRIVLMMVVVVVILSGHRGGGCGRQPHGILFFHQLFGGKPFSSRRRTAYDGAVVVGVGVAGSGYDFIGDRRSVHGIDSILHDVVQLEPVRHERKDRKKHVCISFSFGRHFGK